MTKYFVRTTGERTLDESFSQIEYELLVDTEHSAIKSFVEQLEYLATLDWDVVLLEDDIILCKDFKNRIEEVIGEYKEYVINFFTYPYNYIPTVVTDIVFRFNQCTYYPNKILKELSKAISKYKNETVCGYDTIEQWVFKELGLTYVIHRPCLVQHMDFKSLISKCNGRRTPYFIDYLEELNIPYEEAYKPENKQKLIDLMNEKFKVLKS